MQAEESWWCGNADPGCRVRQASAAIEVTEKKTKRRRFLYVPTPKQAEFTEHPAKYILFGGAAGPGKSHAARWALYRKCLTVPGFEALLLRETFPELERTHLRRMAAEAPLLGAEFIETKRLMKFHHPNGQTSLIECGHMDDDAAVRKYLSSEYDCIVPEEGSAYAPQPLLELFTRARTSKPQVLAAGGSKVWVVSNPGGRAAMMLLDFFIDHKPDFDTYPALRDEYDPSEWVYIPASLDDNPYIDPGYRRQLAILPKWRYEQLRHGNWRIFSGQFFDTWSEIRDEEPWHVCHVWVPAKIEYFGGFDWGRATPGALVPFAALEDKRLHIPADWKYQGMSAEEVGPLYHDKLKEWGIKKLRYVAGDPNIWAKRGEGKGESIAETLIKHRVPLRKGDNDRLSGWARVVAWLRDRPDGDGPWLTVSDEAKYLRRTIPAAVSDKADPEDVDTTGDDHGLDAMRYGLMSRPAPTRISREKPYPVGSWGWERQQMEARQRAGVLA